MKPMDHACLLQIRCDLLCLSCLHVAFNPARSVCACASYSLSILSLAPFQQAYINHRPFSPFTYTWYVPLTIYFLIDDALRSVASQLSFTPYQVERYRIDLLLSSFFFAFSSLTRLARIDAYSFYQQESAKHPRKKPPHINTNVNECR